MSTIRINCALVAITLLSALLLSSCGSAPPAIPDAAGVQDSRVADWPAVLPADYVQPWEEVDAQGYVVASKDGYLDNKDASAINALSEFVPGVEYETTTGDTAELGEGLRLTSGAVGSGALCCATYRLTMGGVQPGVISADVNLRPRSDDSPSTYWLGLSDYGAGCWQWHGPFGDSHVRLSTTEPGTNYLSPLGNTFVCVVAHDGAAIDVVGIGANPRDAVDTTPPEAPTGLVVTPYAGALMLEWHHVAADDLAGYNVYWAKQSFSDPSAWYVQCEPYLEGANWHLLATTPERTYVCITALDISGNESVASDVISAYPLADEPPVVQVTTDVLSGIRGTLVTLTATGAELYDWDLNGDGLVDVTGDTTGTASQTYDAMGLWRPMVKGVSSDGTKAASAAVSLIITGNTRPVASATADPQSGTAPLSVTFTGTAEDDEDEPAELTYSWDFDGDGVYEADTNTLTPAPQEYASSGIYGVKFRVTDTEGAWDVDTIPVQVLPDPDPDNIAPTADIQADPASGCTPLGVGFDASGSTDTDGSIVRYDWDLDGDGNYELYDGGSTPTWTYNTYGSYTAKVRVTDDDGAQATDTVDIGAYTWVAGVVELQDDVGSFTSLARVNSNPAISYYDNTYGDLKYIRACDKYGTAWNMPITIDSTGNVGMSTSLCMVNSHPAISYYNGSNGDLKYVRAIDTSGSAWDTPVTVDSTGDVGEYTSMHVVAGYPAISYYDDTNDQLMYVRASIANGGAWDTPVVVDTDGQVGKYNSLEVIDGNPAISYNDLDNGDLKYVRANDVNGGTWSTPVIVDSLGDVGMDTSLKVINGNPAISYYSFSDSSLKYVRADDASGIAWGTPLTLDIIGDVPEGSSLCVVSGNPAVSYLDTTIGHLKYIRASDATGSAWDTPLVVDGSNKVGYYTSMISYGGQVYISYYAYGGDNLKFAAGSF